MTTVIKLLNDRIDVENVSNEAKLRDKLMSGYMTLVDLRAKLDQVRDQQACIQELNYKLMLEREEVCTLRQLLQMEREKNT